MPILTFVSAPLQGKEQSEYLKTAEARPRRAELLMALQAGRPVVRRSRLQVRPEGSASAQWARNR